MAAEFGDLSSVSSAATEFVQSQSSEGSSAPAEAAPSLPTGEQGTGEAPPVAPAKEYEYDENAVLVVKQKDGSVVKKPLKDVWGGNLRQEDYTRKTQEAAELKKAAQAVLQQSQQWKQEREALKEFLQNPQMVAEYLQQIGGQPPVQPQQPQIDPNGVLTAQEAEMLVQQRLAQLAQAQQHELQEVRNWAQQEIQSTIAQVENIRETGAYAKEIDTHLKSVFAEHPLLNSIEAAEDLIRWKVYNLQPKTIEETKELFSKVAKEQVDKITAAYNDYNKRNIVAKQKLVTNNIEPPGGGGVVPQPQTFRAQDGSVDWKALRDSAVSFIEGNRG